MTGPAPFSSRPPSPPARVRGQDGPQEATQEPRIGAVQLPFAMTVKPKLVCPPAGRPLFDRIVMTLPLASQLGSPFQVAEIRCGGCTVTVVLHELIASSPARTVTRPLNRSPHRSVSS